MSRAAESSEVLAAASVLVAVSCGPTSGTAFEKLKAPSAAAVVDPSYTRASTAASEKMSTAQLGQAIPVADVPSLASRMGGGSSRLPPATLLISSPPLAWIELRRTALPVVAAPLTCTPSPGLL